MLRLGLTSSNETARISTRIVPRTGVICGAGLMPANESIMVGFAVGEASWKRARGVESIGWGVMRFETSPKHNMVRRKRRVSMTKG